MFTSLTCDKVKFNIKNDHCIFLILSAILRCCSFLAASFASFTDGERSLVLAFAFLSLDGEDSRAAADPPPAVAAAALEAEELLLCLNTMYEYMARMRERGEVPAQPNFAYATAHGIKKRRQYTLVK